MGAYFWQFWSVFKCHNSELPEPFSLSTSMFKSYIRRGGGGAVTEIQGFSEYLPDITLKTFSVGVLVLETTKGFVEHESYLIL